MFRLGLLTVLFVTAAIVVACGAPAGSTSAPATSAAPTSPPAAPTAPPAQNPTTGPQSTNLSDLLPAGKGRETFFGSCATCHTLVCAIRGQRTLSRWEALKQDHADKVQGISKADYDTLFVYLSENFNESKPEPKLPEQLLQQGSCAPY